MTGWILIAFLSGQIDDPNHPLPANLGTFATKEACNEVRGSMQMRAVEAHDFVCYSQDDGSSWVESTVYDQREKEKLLERLRQPPAAK